MKLAVLKITRGERVKLPDELSIFLVAAAFGTTPDAVRAWPADDYLFAVNVLPALVAVK